MDVELHPGWPLPPEDYAALLAALDGRASQGRLRLGHSLGALHALMVPSEPGQLLVLLAPSVPKRRRGRTAGAAVLRGISSLPGVRSRVGDSLRRLTYKRYGAEMPSGTPMSLRDAARALTLPLSVFDSVEAPGSCLVIVSREDPRIEEQIRFAHVLTAEIAYVEGGHLFPITKPLETSRAIDVWASAL